MITRENIYQTKQAVVQAIQWKGDNLADVQSFLAPTAAMFDPANKDQSICVPVINHEHMKLYPSLGRQTSIRTVLKGEWIVRGKDGELEIVGAEAFGRMYEPNPGDCGNISSGVIGIDNIVAVLHGPADGANDDQPAETLKDA